MMLRVREDDVEVGVVEERDWWRPQPSLPVGQLPADHQGATSQLRRRRRRQEAGGEEAGSVADGGDSVSNVVLVLPP